MLVSQYVYFALRSNLLPATEIAAMVGIEPDEVVVRGSRQQDPVRPVVHQWKIVCREPSLSVDEQIGVVVDRLFDRAARIGEVAAEIDRVDAEPESSVLQVVREFSFEEQPDGEEPPGQSPLLGWHLDARTLEFLRLTRAELDVDEYGP